MTVPQNQFPISDTFRRIRTELTQKTTSKTIVVILFYLSLSSCHTPPYLLSCNIRNGHDRSAEPVPDL